MHVPKENQTKKGQLCCPGLQEKKIKKNLGCGSDFCG